MFKKPSYQAAIPGTRRTLPDVAMLADIAPGFVVYCSARPECVSNVPGETNPWQAVGGTSAATPLLAGGLAMIDQLLVQHKQQSLGLVNPLLYSIGANPAQAPLVYADVASGSNDVGPFIANAKPLGCCTATPGFDAASGWGAVNLLGLSTVALAAQPAIVNVSQRVLASQKVVAHRVIYDTVSCSGVCQLGALARVTIGSAKPVTLYSGLAHLTAAGSKVVKIPVTKAEEARLKAGLSRHLKITAKVIGAIVDPAGNVERQTAGKIISITR